MAISRSVAALFEIASSWPMADISELPDGWAELALRALREIGPDAGRIIRIDVDEAALCFWADGDVDLGISELLPVLDRAREQSRRLCEACGETGARRTGTDNRLCAAHAPDLRAWGEELTGLDE